MTTPRTGYSDQHRRGVAQGEAHRASRRGDSRCPAGRAALPVRVVEGTVVDTTTPTPLDVREEIAIRYLGEEGGRAFVASMKDQDSVLFTVRPDRWLTADFSDEL